MLHVLLHHLFWNESKQISPEKFLGIFPFRFLGGLFCFVFVFHWPNSGLTPCLSTHLPIIPVDYQQSLCMRWLDTVPKLLSNSVSAPGIKTHCLRPLPFSTAARAWLVITGKLHRSQSPPLLLLLLTAGCLMCCSTLWPRLGTGPSLVHSFLLKPQPGCY